MSRFSTVLLLLNAMAVTAALEAGDIAITRVQSDNPDIFNFVALVDIPSEESIKFTDNGWRSDGSFRDNEGTITWTAPAAGVPAGTEVEIQNGAATLGSVTGSVALSASGDQVLAYQGDDNNPTFLFAVQTNSNQFQTDATNSNDSALPTGLVVGETAVAVGLGPGAGDETDNSAYDCSVLSGDKDTLLAAIANNANWISSQFDPIGSGSCSSFSVDQAGLQAGDIAITRVQTDNPDIFNFVALVDIPSEESIKFTDNGWRSDGSFRDNEGTITWTAPAAGVPAGTEVEIQNGAATLGSVTGSVALSASGDQVLAYQGDDNNPTFLFAVQTNSNQFQTDATNSNDSALPTGLVVGETAVAVGLGPGAGDETDNSAYDCSVLSGDKDTLLAAIANNANWISSQFDPIGSGSCSSFSVDGGASGPTAGPTMPMPTADPSAQPSLTPSVSLRPSASPTMTPRVTVQEVQGTGSSSPFEDREVIIEEAYVTRKTPNGYFAQQADPDEHILASSGIFVFTGSTDTGVESGDKVRIPGKVVEFFGETQIRGFDTEIIQDAKKKFIHPIELELPVDKDFDYELFEGMLLEVEAEKKSELYVSEYFELDRFGK